MKYFRKRIGCLNYFLCIMMALGALSMPCALAADDKGVFDPAKAAAQVSATTPGETWTVEITPDKGSWGIFWSFPRDTEEKAIRDPAPANSAAEKYAKLAGAEIVSAVLTGHVVRTRKNSSDPDAIYVAGEKKLYTVRKKGGSPQNNQSGSSDALRAARRNVAQLFAKNLFPDLGRLRIFFSDMTSWSNFTSKLKGGGSGFTAVKDFAAIHQDAIDRVQKVRDFLENIASVAESKQSEILDKLLNDASDSLAASVTSYNDLPGEVRAKDEATAKYDPQKFLRELAGMVSKDESALLNKYAQRIGPIKPPRYANFADASPLNPTGKDSALSDASMKEEGTGETPLQTLRRQEKALAEQNRILAEAAEQERMKKEFESEIAKSGLKLGEGDVQVSLTWDSSSDVDLSVHTPSGETLTYNKKTSSDGGRLDVDNTKAYGPENVYWPAGRSPKGTYAVRVNLFRGSSANFKVRVLRGGKAYFYSGYLRGKGDSKTVTRFSHGE